MTICYFYKWPGLHIKKIKSNDVCDQLHFQQNKTKTQTICFGLCFWGSCRKETCWCTSPWLIEALADCLLPSIMRQHGLTPLLLKSLRSVCFCDFGDISSSSSSHHVERYIFFLFLFFSWRLGQFKNGHFTKTKHFTKDASIHNWLVWWLINCICNI